MHGNVYKQPNIPESKLDDLADKFLIDTSVDELPPDQAAHARNVTAEIFVTHQRDVDLTFNIQTPSGDSQRIDFPYSTTTLGDFDAFVEIETGDLADGDSANEIQRLHVDAVGTDISNGHAIAYLVPPIGITIISDIDDTLRVTKIYRPKEGLLNTFARSYVPWMNMPDIFLDWSRLPNVHFHYLSTTLERLTRNYMEFVYKTYPEGSFDTRPLNFGDLRATLSIRDFLLRKIFATYPQRKFVLVGDTSSLDVLKDYSLLAKDFPDQVQCIFIRKTDATDSEDKIPYDTSKFQDVDPNLYMFFNVPVISIFSFNCLINFLKPTSRSPFSFSRNSLSNTGFNSGRPRRP